MQDSLGNEFYEEEKDAAVRKNGFPVPDKIEWFQWPELKFEPKIELWDYGTNVIPAKHDDEIMAAVLALKHHIDNDFLGEVYNAEPSVQTQGTTGTDGPTAHQAYQLDWGGAGKPMDAVLAEPTKYRVAY